MTTWLYDSLDESVCPGRHIVPKPGDVKQAEAEMLAGTLVDRVKAFFMRNTEPVDKLGTPFNEVNEALAEEAGKKIDGNIMKEAGVLLKSGSRPGNVKVHKFRFPTGVAQVQLKRERVHWHLLLEATP